ncbi:MAG: Heterocyst differentiation ATP-binding protein HepA [Cellvibrionales bacterium UBA7375]|nr:MAG: Heterocyst differentiation ATP-binding protein HepA [Cellvibrionales bacterium UBA7375]
MPYTSLRQLLPRLWSHITSVRRMQIALLFLLMILTTFVELISLGAVLPFLGVLTAPEKVFVSPLAQPLINLFSFTEPEQLLMPLTIIFITSALFAGCMRLLLLLVQTRISQAIGADFSLHIYRTTLYQPYSVHVLRNTSEVIAGVRGKANSLVSHTIFPIMIICSSMMMLLTIMSALVAIEPVVSGSAFVGFAIIYLIFIKVTKNTLALNSQLQTENAIMVLKDLNEGLGSIRDVLLDGTQEIYADIYKKSDLPYRRAEANVQIISNFPRYGVEALGISLIAVLAYLMVRSSGDFVDAIPVLGALAVGAQRLLPVLQQAYANWSMIRGGQASMSDALDLLDQPLPDYAGKPLSSAITFERSITLDNISFRYTENTPWVLHPGINLSIKKGDKIGFIGSTGSGKSTLLDIIMALLQPSVGEFKIDGQVISERNFRSWQALISHVPQAVFLADTSISKNIALGVPADQIDHTRVRHAAEMAKIAKTIESWDLGYDTEVGENGVRLSGGQRQRIGIARALYKKAEVIILDEATSALDNNTEREVMKAIEELSDDLTLIIVAHRLTTLKGCTQIVELTDGRITRKGSYEEIIQ